MAEIVSEGIYNATGGFNSDGNTLSLSAVLAISIVPVVLCIALLIIGTVWCCVTHQKQKTQVVLTMRRIRRARRCEAFHINVEFSRPEEVFTDVIETMEGLPWPDCAVTESQTQDDNAKLIKKDENQEDDVEIDRNSPQDVGCFGMFVSGGTCPDDAQLDEDSHVSPLSENNGAPSNNETNAQHDRDSSKTAECGILNEACAELQAQTSTDLCDNNKADLTI